MAIRMYRPEHKLRDLARRVIGISEKDLGELDIHQVAALFLKRKMTYNIDQLGNLMFRRLREHAMNTVFKPAYSYGHYGNEDERNAFFLIHDEKGHVNVAKMEDKGKYFPVTIKEISEGPLFEGTFTTFGLRHPCPDIIWCIYMPKDEKIQSRSTKAMQLENKGQCSWVVHPGLGKNEDSFPKGAPFLKKIKHYYSMQNLDVPLGMARYTAAPNLGLEERTLLGFNETPEASWSEDCRNIWVAEMRWLMTQMSDGFCGIPDIRDIARRSIRGKIAAFAVQNGLTFSEREVALFIHNAPERDEDRRSEIIAHDDDGNVFTVEISWKKDGARVICVSPADNSYDFSSNSSATKLYLRVHTTSALWHVVSVPLQNDNKGYGVED